MEVCVEYNGRIRNRIILAAGSYLAVQSHSQLERYWPK